MNQAIQPSGASGSAAVVTQTSSSTTVHERHTKALLVMLMVLIGISVGIYVGKGEV